MGVADVQRRQVFYSGRVQGVGFRYTVRSLAAPLAVAGYVRNLSDGRVELVVEGTRDEVGRLLAAVRQAMGQYIHAEQEGTPPAGGLRGFEIRF